MGRLYGRERFQPGLICGQIWALQLLFYANFGLATFVGCVLVGADWTPRFVFTDEFYDGAYPAHSDLID